MATLREALIVAHGSPSAPEAPERQLAEIGAEVSARLPGWRIATATLGAKGSLDHALDALERPLVYPFFMSEGWFTNTHLPQRLSAANQSNAPQLLPFGVDTGLIDLIARRVMAAAADDEVAAGEATLLFAAHGSRSSAYSAQAAHRVVAAIKSRGIFADVAVGFIEEAPFLYQSAPLSRKSYCLPFFALTASHVTDDVPQNLRQSGFQGRLLPPIGSDPAVAGLIAAALEGVSPDPVSRGHASSRIPALEPDRTCG
ncbi:MAG: cobalamin biosynthesis protein CbiX [Rhodobacteraceae bacterium]|nr:cobalamin biosynthesis protein CbiX [Paracoccaceae bacterium]